MWLWWTKGAREMVAHSHVKSWEAIVGRKEHLMNAQMAANTPILMANAMPNFSLVFICSLRMMVHGRRARARSEMPE